MMKDFRRLVLFCVVFIHGILAYSQNGNPAQLTDPHGDQPFGSYQVSDIDQIGFGQRLAGCPYSIVFAAWPRPGPRKVLSLHQQELVSG
jgi:hypothetical protein